MRPQTDRPSHKVLPGLAAAAANRIDEIVAEASHPAHGISASAPLKRYQVMGAAQALRELAERLRATPEPCAEGVARARMLLTDPSSPIFAPAEPGTLAHLARAAADAL